MSFEIISPILPQKSDEGKGFRSFLLECGRKSHISSYESIFRNSEFITMFVSFPTHGHMLWHNKARSRYDFLVRKGKKNEWNPKINKKIYLTTNLTKFFENTKNKALIINDIKTHKKKTIIGQKVKQNTR